MEDDISQLTFDKSSDSSRAFPKHKKLSEKFKWILGVLLFALMAILAFSLDLGFKHLLNRQDLSPEAQLNWASRTIDAHLEEKTAVFSSLLRHLVWSSESSKKGANVFTKSYMKNLDEVSYMAYMTINRENMNVLHKTPLSETQEFKSAIKKQLDDLAMAGKNNKGMTFFIIQLDGEILLGSAHHLSVNESMGGTLVAVIPFRTIERKCFGSEFLDRFKVVYFWGDRVFNHSESLEGNDFVGLVSKTFYRGGGKFTILDRESNQSLSPSLVIWSIAGVLFLCLCPLMYRMIYLYQNRERRFQIELRERTIEINKYKRLFHVSQDGMCIMGDSDTLINANLACETMFGYDRDGLFGKPIGQLIPVLQRNNYGMSFSKFFRMGLEKGLKVRELEAINQHGDRFIVEVSVSKFSNDIISQYIISIRDISEKVNARLKLEKAYQELKELDTLKTSFLSNVSHELRTPLTAIISSANILSNCIDKVDKKQNLSPREILESSIRDKLIPENHAPVIERIIGTIGDFSPVIKSEAERLSRIVADLLDITRIESGNFTWKIDNFSTQKLLTQIQSNFRAKADEMQIEIMVDDSHADLEIESDKDRLIQVITNFVSNAMKFSQSGGSIQLRRTIIGKEMTISVKDEGPGIDPENQDKIFGRFEQAGTHSMNSKGIGLGLYISKQIVENLGGRIGVDSELGRGATFWFKLPVNSVKPMTGV